MRGYKMALVLSVLLCGPALAADDAKASNDPFVTHGAEEPTEDAKRACAQMLQSIRSQVELYKLQHGDKYPTTSGGPVGSEWQWELMMRVTTDPGGRKVGPYLPSIPVNPVARSSKVVGKPEAGGGWLLDESGRFFALDQNGAVFKGSDLPKAAPPGLFVQASPAARMSAARSMTQTLRSQLELYKLQHEDRYPTKSGRAVGSEWQWELMTKVTEDPNGRKVGPYLLAPAMNPLTNSDRVVGKPEKGAGWVLTPEGEVEAMTAEGKVLR